MVRDKNEDRRPTPTRTTRTRQVKSLTWLKPSGGYNLLLNANTKTRLVRDKNEDKETDKDKDDEDDEEEAS